MIKRGFQYCMIIVSIMNLLVRSQYDYAYCTYYQNGYYQFPESYDERKTIETSLDLNSQLKLGLGFWMSYRPISNGKVIQNRDVTADSIKQVFVFSFESNNISSILFYIQFSRDSITHNVQLLTKNGLKIVMQDMDYMQYEGDWIFVYFYIDQMITVFFFTVRGNEQFQQTIQESLVLQTSMIAVTGGSRNVETLQLQVYPGIIQPVIMNFGFSLFDNFYEFSWNCQPINQCSLYSQTLITFNNTFTDDLVFRSAYISRMSYTLKGWIKLDSLGYNSPQTKVLLRISTCQHNSDNNQIGDRLLYIMYYQSNIDIQQNGFTLQTYSYTFPWRPSEHKTDQSDIIYALDQEYKDLIIQWHYFQYEYGTYTNNGQPIYTVYFTSIDTIRQYTWNKQINHFTTNNLYFNIGGDEYYPNTFQGQLSDWIFTSLCNDIFVEFKPSCHYSCAKCKGITQHDCISCKIQNLRVYSESQHTCQCLFGLIDAPQQARCQQLNQYSTVFNLEEQEIIIQKEGYYSIEESNIICEVGYFKYNNICIKCPYEPQVSLIKCADCYFYPEIFSQTLSCTLKLQSSDDSTVLFQTKVNNIEFELFSIEQNSSENYQLKMKKGHILLDFCKTGYFLSSNDVCQECPINCQECVNDFICKSCEPRYQLDSNGNCIFCENCVMVVKYVLENSYDPVEFVMCQERQYQKNELCIDCGQYCQECSENECYYCQDQTQYFLTLDLFNCAKCSIDNCKYCFQYLMYEQVIKTSLDTSIKIDQQYSEIKTACAQCNDGYIFSFITFKCELKPQNMQDCQSGIINENQQQICLISETRDDAIQQSSCTVQNCKSCIKNYSETILEFCIICIDGYYSSLKNGQCKKCPINCQTCAQYDSAQQNFWKLNIRAFYQYFINSKRDHYFEDYQSNRLIVACIDCYPNFLLTSELTCEQLCSEDCLDCQSYIEINGVFTGVKYRCNKCKQATFNELRSVIPGSINQCLSCPDYCSACCPRSTAEIQQLNPFFNLQSTYMKYSYICYAYTYFYNVNSVPKYLVPNVCQNYKVCEKSVKLSFKLYCDLTNWYQSKQDESDIEFENILQFDMLSGLKKQEILEYMNQQRVSKISYDFELIKEPHDDECFVATGLNFTNNWNQDVFTLEKAQIAFWKSARSQLENIPFLLYSGFQTIDFDQVTFFGVQFLTLNEYYSSQANISFINQYYPITLILMKCEIIAFYWLKSTILTFTSDKIQNLTIESLNLKDLMIKNSAIFDLQPQKNTYSKQNITELIVINSSFINSSIFFYNANQFSLNQTVYFTNIKIMNCNFSNSNFINSSFFQDFTNGEIFLMDFHLENLILENNSILFQVLNSKIFNVKNIKIKNLILEDQSSIFVCNLISIYDLQILNSYINSGNFINVYQQSLIKRSHKIANEIFFEKVSFVNISFSSSNTLIKILQDQQSIVKFTCLDLLLDNNNFIDMRLGKQQFNYISYKQSQIYIDCNVCFLQNLQIFRGIGLPEISIVNSQSLEINNFHLKSRKEYFKRYLHSSVECARNVIYLDIPFTLYIWAYQKVLLDNITISETIVADYPLINFLGQSLTESVQSETISITNSIFEHNLLLILNENRQSSIISVETKQTLKMTIYNVIFNNNLLNAYYQNNLDHSSTALSINAQQGNIYLELTQFERNIITNSSDSIMHIQASKLVILNCNFQNQNILTDDIFLKNLISLKQSKISMNNIYIDFPILSQGGNGHIEVSSFEMKNSSLFNSLARNGGGFYVVTLSQGIIQILNCYFQNTSTILNGNYISSGGLLYIDSSQGILNLTVKHCQINQAYSRTFGGAIFIEPSKSINNICFDNLEIYSVFSIQHSFLSFSPNKLIVVSSSILITNIYYQSNETEFEKYSQQLTGLSSQNIELFQNENPIIYILFSEIIMVNCSFLNIHLANIIEIDQATSINLQFFKIYNSTIFQSAIIKLSLSSDKNGSILLKNIVLQNIKEASLQNFEICNSIQVFSTKLLCPQFQSDINDNPAILQFQLDYQNQLKCNLNLLYSTISKQNFSIIQVVNSNLDHQIFFEDLEISFVSCTICYYGIISIQSQYKIFHLHLKNLKMLNNNCGVLGCLSILKSANNNDYLEISQGSNLIFNVTMEQSIFLNNNATYGGACFFSKIDILINNSIFFNNQAANSGGSINYISENTTLLIINSVIVNNSANIGGGVYLQEQSLEKFNELNLFIQDNSGSDFADNLFETPRFIYLSLDKVNRQKNIELLSNSSIIMEQIKIDPYYPYNSESLTDVLLLPSGISVSQYKYFNKDKNSYSPFNISFRLQAANLFGEKIENLENTECEIFATVQNKSNTTLDFFINYQSQDQFLSYSKIVFNAETQDYNLDDLIIYFNPYQDESQQLQLAFICNSLKIPFYNSTSPIPDSIITNYILFLNIRTLQCQLGEYFNQTTGGCVLCDVTQSQYSVTVNSSSCQYKDETTIAEIEPALIKLKQNYWRAYYYSEIIETCHNLPANCQGGWFAGNPSCATGHIGALCEQCDLYNVKGEGSFSQSQSYQCSNCASAGGNIINIIFVFLWTFLSVLLTVTSTIYMIESFVFQLKLKPLGFYTVFKSASTSILLKVFTNYLQIMSSITSFQLSVPIIIQLAIRGVGNPLGSMAFSLDCYLRSLTHIPMIYFRIIWGFVIAGMYISLFLFIHIVLSACKKNIINITFITTTFIYIFIYLSPNQVSELSLLISNRNISGEKWIAANVAYLYDTQIGCYILLPRHS